MKNNNIKDSSEIIILKGRLVELSQQYKALKLQIFPAAIRIAEKAMSDFNLSLNAIKPFADRITAAAKGKITDFTDEEQALLKTTANFAQKLISESQSFTVEQLANNANLLANAKGIAKIVSMFKYALPLSNIERLKKTKTKIDANKNIQTFHPTADDIKLLNDAKAECEKWIESYSKEPRTAAGQENLALVTKMRLNYSKLSQNFDNCQGISPATEEVLGIAVDMAAENRLDNKKLTKAEKLLVNDFRENLQSLANAQQNGRFPQQKIRENLTEDEMERASGDRTAIAVMTLEDGIPVIAIAKKCKNPKATIAHETQHIIQYQKGELAYLGNAPLHWLYDIYDEVDAHKMQYLAVPTSLKKPIESIDEITPAYLSNNYGHLPQVRLSLTSTFEEIQNALVAADNGVGPKTFFEEIANLANNPIKINWDDIKNMPLKDFFSSTDAMHQAAVNILRVNGLSYY
jgi:hypothetical protein